MALWKNTQHAFVAGQLDSLVHGRQDMDKYFKGATTITNFLVKRQGCISKRRGTDLTADLAGLLGTKYDGTPITPSKMRLVPVTNGDDGRYVILSNGLCFVASRDGVLTSDRNHIRTIPAYVAEDADGKAVVTAAKDARANTETPVDLIHRNGVGNYTVTRHTTLQSAFNASVDGDTIRLHGNLLLTSAVTVTPSNSWKTDADASATVTWDGDHAGHPNQYKIVRSGTTYYSRESDYYGTRSSITFNDRFVTATRNWSFSDANAWSATWSGNTWTFTRTSGSDTVTATKNGSLSDTTVTFTDGGETVTATCTWSFSGTDYDSSKTYTMAVENYYWRMKATDGSTTWSGTVYVPSYSATVQVVSKVTTVTEAAKHVTLDLFGYKITMRGGRVVMRNASLSLTVDSTRTGASVVLTGTGNPVGFEGGSRIDRIPSGSWTFKGNILYQMHTGSATMILVKDTEGLTIESGRFESVGKATQGYGNNVINLLGGVLTINGGIFTNEIADSDVRLVWSGLDNSRKYASTVVVNGGEFRNDSTVTGCCIFKNDADGVRINGGRFIYPDSSRCVSKLDYRGHTWWSYNFLRIVRGEFATSSLACGYDSGHDHALADYAEDGSVPNETQPNADGYYGVKVSGEGDYRYDGFSSDPLPFRIAIPYADEDLADLCIRQSGDTLFIAHREYPPAKIYFDKYGYANFEELEFDNTSVYPPVIDSAEKSGFDPQQTDYPDGYDSSLKSQAEALGVVTEAGKNSNSATGSDGSYNNATTYNATVVDKNSVTGVKTTHMLVKSVTSSRAFEVESTFTNGVKTGESRHAIDTSGTAQNNAKAASVMVMRTVRYVATYVKDGKESRPSVPFAIDYDMPWPNNAVVNLTVSKGSNADEPDYYNIYKDNGNGYGLIGTTGMDNQTGGISGFADTYPLFMPDNTGTAPALVNAADYEEKKGWANGDILRKLISTGRDAFSTSPANDICLVNTASNATGGIVFDFSKQGGARFNVIKVMLDGRIYDKTTRSCYIIVSTSRVTCTVTYNKTDGTTGTTSLTASDAHSYAYGGISGGWMEGIYSDWVGLPYRTFTAPNGDTVYGWLYGVGDCAEEFNTHLRYVTFDFYSTFKGITGFKNVKSIKFTFDTSVYSYWTNNQQGCIHAIHFSNRGANASSGMFQDDYINPDMTVTPPADEKDPHFSSVDEYPGSVGIYQQRLCFASTNSSPSTLWMSRVADLYNFTPHDSIREDDAMELTLAATEFPKLNHLITGRDLMLFGDGGEWLVAPVQGNTLTYKTASAKLQSMIGSERTLNPLQLADETLFAERGGTCLRSINYNYSSDSYQSQDLSVLSQSIFRANPIVSMAYKQHPDSIVECVLKDGRVATLVYMKEQEVMAWSVQQLAGGWKAREIVTPKCIVNGTTEMMLLVEKDGVFQLWKVRDDDDELTAAKQVILDGLHVEGHADAATGEVAVPLGDGTYAHGLVIESEFVSVRPEPEKGATAQMEIKNATESEIRVIDATTFRVKPYNIAEGWREVPLPPVQTGTAVALREADVKKTLTGTNNRDGRIHLVHTEPWPLTILSISNTYQVEYENGDGKGGQQ